MFASLPIELEWENHIDEPRFAPRHMGDRLKRLFYKNRTWEVIAIRSGAGGA
jgi:hypothetical protein